MRASIFIGTSLDGFIARSNGDLDFLPPAGGEPHGYDEFMATVDALVIGRKTFETVLAFDAWPYAQKPAFVLRSRPLAPAPPRPAVVPQWSPGRRRAAGCSRGAPVGRSRRDRGAACRSWPPTYLCRWRG